MYRNRILQVPAFLLLAASVCAQTADVAGEWQVTAHQLGQTENF
jgi:hypothetical protein